MSKNKTYEPVGHRVLVKIRKVEERTEGGLYLPQQTQHDEQYAMEEGELTAIGPQAWATFGDGAPWAYTGDMVVFAKYAGKVLEFGGNKYRVMNDEDIYCRVISE